MPFETAVTPFTGDGNMQEFMNDVWVPFARDDCKWADNQSPGFSPERTGGDGLPTSQFWMHRQARSGSPLAVESPFQPLPPFVFYEAENDHLYIFTGSDVDQSLTIENQPGNPANTRGVGLVDDGSGTSYVGSGFRCPVINDIIGTYDAYWLFSDDEGSYIHCVVKVRSREYRHFHVGLIRPLHPELDPSAFYVTGHFWDQLNSRYTGNTTEPDNDLETSPYNTQHRIPFNNCPGGNELGNPPGPRQQFTGTWVYAPGLQAEADWYIARAIDDQFTEDAPEKAFSPTDPSPNPWPENFGVCQFNGWGGLGNTLFMADRTFTSNTTSLVPFFVAANVDFQSDIRLGVFGQIPDVFRVNMRDFAPEEEINIGSDTYVVFPLINDDSANILPGEGYSGWEGLAYKKIDNGPVP